MTIILTLLALVSPLAAPAASAVGWISVARDRDGELSYDPASLTRTGSRVRLTTRVVAMPGPGDPPWSMIARQEVDCVKASVALLSAEQYGAGPDPVRTRTVPPERIEREPVYAGSNFAGLYRAACPKGARLKPEPHGPPVIVVPRTD